MLGQSYFQLLSPMIFLAFSLGFALLWSYARNIRALPLFAFSYFLGGCAMIGDFLRDTMVPDVASAVLTVLYLSGTVYLCAGFHVFYRDRAPWRMLMTSAAAVFVLFCWLRYGFDNLVPATWAINGGIVAIVSHMQFAVRRETRRRIDLVLHAVLAASSAALLIRTAVVLWYEGATMTETNYPGSLAAVTLQLVIAVSALAVAGILLVMFGMEIVRKLTETSETDPLTGVLNRRGFEARISALANDGQAGKSGHAIVMADMDRFKSINDAYGHKAGDAVIKTFAQVLHRAARENDFIVRWGGEEFLVLIAHADAAAGRLFAETVRMALETMRHDCLDGGTVTASFGIAAWSGDCPMADAAHLADLALYRAKREGRNRVCLYSPDMDEKFSETVAAQVRWRSAS